MNVTLQFDFIGLIVCEIVIRQNVIGIVEKQREIHRQNFA